MPKCFVFNIDSKLFDTTKPTTIKMLEVLQKVKSKNHLLIATTHKNQQFIKEFTNYFNLFDYVIFKDGIYSYDIAQNIIFNEHFLTNEIIHELIEQVSTYPIVLKIYTIANHYGTKISPTKMKLSDKTWSNQIQTLLIPLDNLIEKLQYEDLVQVAIMSDPIPIQALINNLKIYHDFLKVSVPNPCKIIIQAKDSSFWAALSQIVKLNKKQIKTLIIFNPNSKLDSHIKSDIKFIIEQKIVINNFQKILKYI